MKLPLYLKKFQYISPTQLPPQKDDQEPRKKQLSVKNCVKNIAHPCNGNIMDTWCVAQQLQLFQRYEKKTFKKTFLFGDNDW